MKRILYSSTNLPLYTLNGSKICRSKYGVGKSIGGNIYVHKDYAAQVVPPAILSTAEHILQQNEPDFEYNCIKYDPARRRISFQEVPDFDSAREPTVGDYIIVDVPTGQCKSGHSNYIFHHKWLWVDDNYTGFDVNESYEWSKKWLAKLPVPSDGNGLDRWKSQLKQYEID